MIRHSFVARHKALVQGQRVPWEHAGIGTAVLVGLAIWLAPPPPSAAALGRCRQAIALCPRSRP